MRKLGNGIATAVLASSLVVLAPVKCLAQSDYALRGPIGSPASTTPGAGAESTAPAGSSSSTNQGSASTGVTTGADSNPGGSNNLLMNGGLGGQAVGQPASDASTDPTNIHDPTTGPSTVSIPMSFGNKTQKKPLPPLSAVISSVELTTDPNEYVLGPYHGLHVHVHNGTDRPLVLNGDMATMHLGSEIVRPISIRQVDYEVCPPLTTGEQALVAAKVAVTVGWNSAIADEKVQRGIILGRYGCDEHRRQDEQNRFGKRILWPGDDSDGVVYFQTDQSLKGGTIEMPISMTDANNNSVADQNSGTTTGAPSGNSSTVPEGVGSGAQNQIAPNAASGGSLQHHDHAKHGIGGNRHRLSPGKPAHSDAPAS